MRIEMENNYYFSFPNRFYSPISNNRCFLLIHINSISQINPFPLPLHFTHARAHVRATENAAENRKPLHYRVYV